MVALGAAAFDPVLNEECLLQMIILQAPYPISFSIVFTVLQWRKTWKWTGIGILILL